MAGNGTVIIRGGQPIKWGTDGFMPQGTIVNTYDKGKRIETNEIKNNVGNTCSVVVYDKKQEITLEVVYDPTAATQPDAGDVITVGSGTEQFKALVTAADESYKQDDAAVVKITATNWENVDLTLEEIQGASAQIQMAKGSVAQQGEQGATEQPQGEQGATEQPQGEQGATEQPQGEQGATEQPQGK